MPLLVAPHTQAVPVAEVSLLLRELPPSSCLLGGVHSRICGHRRATHGRGGVHGSWGRRSIGGRRGSWGRRGTGGPRGVRRRRARGGGPCGEPGPGCLVGGRRSLLVSVSAGVCCSGQCLVDDLLCTKGGQLLLERVLEVQVGDDVDDIVAQALEVEVDSHGAVQLYIIRGLEPIDENLIFVRCSRRIGNLMWASVRERRRQSSSGDQSVHHENDSLEGAGYLCVRVGWFASLPVLFATMWWRNWLNGLRGRHGTRNFTLRSNNRCSYLWFCVHLAAVLEALFCPSQSRINQGAQIDELIDSISRPELYTVGFPQEYENSNTVAGYFRADPCLPLECRVPWFRLAALTIGYSQLLWMVLGIHSPDSIGASGEQDVTTHSRG
ncbi:MAG: hypothetical protein J3Q66DRAFT_374712 [Benniella sp.]|nr:MAG: hypothetical protein J3Q66DRAFT_374712 [Benniella sp.]